MVEKLLFVACGCVEVAGKFFAASLHHNESHGTMIIFLAAWSLNTNCEYKRSLTS